MLWCWLFITLQVDDNIVNRRVATSMLSRYGATVISSNSGLEAVVAVKNQQAGMAYDLILMDIQMPEVNFFCNLKNKTCLVLLICTLSASCMHTKYIFLLWLLTLNSWVCSCCQSNDDFLLLIETHKWVMKATGILTSLTCVCGIDGWLWGHTADTELGGSELQTMQGGARDLWWRYTPETWEY